MKMKSKEMQNNDSMVESTEEKQLEEMEEENESEEIADLRS